MSSIISQLNMEGNRVMNDYTEWMQHDTAYERDQKEKQAGFSGKVPRVR